MRIAIFETMPGEREALRSQLPSGHETFFFETPLNATTAHLAANAEIVSVFVKSTLNRDCIDALPGLQLITTRSMGYDHIDVAYASSRGIRCANVTTYAAHPVAEFTFTLLLAVMRKLYPAYHRLRESSEFDIRGLSGHTLFEKTIGIIGTGRIGKQVASIANGFGLHCIAYDPHPDTLFAAQHGVTYLSALDVFAKADIITIHIPSTPETHHFVNTAAFDAMKTGVVIINTARGEVMDTHALIAALKQGKVWGAGLDVLEQESAFANAQATDATGTRSVDYEMLSANHLLIDMPNVVVTPHIAFETAEALAEIIRVTASTISTFISGGSQTYLS